MNAASFTLCSFADVRSAMPARRAPADDYLCKKLFLNSSTAIQTIEEKNTIRAMCWMDETMEVTRRERAHKKLWVVNSDSRAHNDRTISVNTHL